MRPQPFFRFRALQENNARRHAVRRCRTPFHQFPDLVELRIADGPVEPSVLSARRPKELIVGSLAKFAFIGFVRVKAIRCTAVLVVSLRHRSSTKTRTVWHSLSFALTGVPAKICDDVDGAVGDVFAHRSRGAVL